MAGSARRIANPPVLAELGDTGLKIQNGTIWEEYLPQLKGRKGVEAYQEMADSALCGAFLLILDLIANKVEYKVKPAKENDEAAQAQADWLDGALQDLRTPFKQVVSEQLTCVPYGWARAEILYKLRRGPAQQSDLLRSDFSDGQWGWLDFEPRSQDSLDPSDPWDWDDASGRLLGMRQWVPYKRSGQDRFYIPEDKAIAAVPRPWKRSPEGRSMFRPGYRNWFFGRKLEDIEGLGAERNLTGLLKIELPKEVMAPDAPAEYRAVRVDWEKKASKIRRGQMEAIVMPAETDGNGVTGFKASLMNSGGQAPYPLDTTIRRHESRLLISLLSEFLLLGMDKVGSWALSETKMNVVSLAMGGLLDACIIGPFNNKAIPDLYRLNAVPDELWPTLEYSDIDAPTIAEISDLLSKLVGASVVLPSAELEEWTLRKLGAPSKAERDEPTVNVPAEIETPAAVGDQQPTVGGEPVHRC